MNADPAAMPAVQQGAVDSAHSDAAARGRRSRGAAKRKVIAEAATAVFLQDGYVAASMDEVAAAAGVSKQTVYHHFGSKEKLFLAVINQAIHGVLDEFLTLARSFPGSDDLEGSLIRLGRVLLTRIVDPEFIAVRRLTIAEVGRFPQLGRAWWEAGPSALISALAESLPPLAERGELVIDDPATAASDFNWLVLSKPMNMMLFGIADAFTPAEVEEFVTSAVRVFLNAYRPHDCRASHAPANGSHVQGKCPETDQGSMPT